MQENASAKFRIVRISLMDLGIKHDKQDALFGKETNVWYDERLQNYCNKQVANYWNGHSIRQFEDSIAQFEMTIKQYIEHVLS